MIKIFLILINIAFFSVSNVFSQSKSWEVYAGGSLCNVMHILNGQQSTLNHTLNAPFWNYGYILGINKSLYYTKDKRLELSSGIRIQLKGDSKSLKEVAPRDTVYGIRFLYAMLPINLNWKIFPSREIFIKSGFSIDYLAHKQKISETSVVFFSDNSFKDRWEVSCQLGVKFKIVNDVYAELMYSQGITPIYKYTLQSPVLKAEFSYINQAFEVSIIYKL